MYNLTLAMTLPRQGDQPRVAISDDQDQFHRIEEQVHRRVAEHLRGALPDYLHITDDNSGADDEALAQPRKEHKWTSRKLRRVDTMVINQVTWPHELIYTHSDQPAIYDQLSSMAFVNGYLAVMALESDQVKMRMLAHLQEMMEDRETYGWCMVRSYHVAWFQQLEHGMARQQSSR